MAKWRGRHFLPPTLNDSVICDCIVANCRLFIVSLQRCGQIKKSHANHMSIMTREAVGASLATATGAARFKTTQMIRFTTLILSAFVACAALAQGLPTDGPLTIDPKLQALGKRLLRGKQGSMVAIEPATGRVLALVSADRVGEDINRAISKEYSPGSTFKVAQALAMLS